MFDIRGLVVHASKIFRSFFPTADPLQGDPGGEDMRRGYEDITKCRYRQSVEKIRRKCKGG
jgi:hypothetical protein